MGAGCWPSPHAPPILDHLRLRISKMGTETQCQIDVDPMQCSPQQSEARNVSLLPVLREQMPAAAEQKS